MFTEGRLRVRLLGFVLPVEARLRFVLRAIAPATTPAVVAVVAPETVKTYCSFFLRIFDAAVIATGSRTCSNVTN